MMDLTPSSSQTPAGYTRRPRRPCDQCRRRKSRCMINPNDIKCFFCSIKDRRCTFLHDPPPRNTIRERHATPSGSESSDLGGRQRYEDRGSEISAPRSPMTLTMKSHSPLTHSPRVERTNAVLGDITRLKGTLGLQVNLHAKYVSLSSFHEPALLDLRSSLLSKTNRTFSHPRVVGQSVVFLVDPEVASHREQRRLFLLDEIESCVQASGPLLIDLYFKTFHHIFPVLDRAIFVEKRARSHHEFSPPLLAAVYLVALNWRPFDHVLNATTKLDDASHLRDLAVQAMQEELATPNLSTLQAGLLLLQEGLPRLESLHAQLVVMAQNLGIHVNCEHWQIPDWEKSLRRRLAWTLVMQDQWSIVTHGRPPLITIEPASSNWTVGPCTIADLSDKPPERDDESMVMVDREASITGFIQLIQLTKIFARILASFYSGTATQPDGSLRSIGLQGAVRLAQSFTIELQAWRAGLPNPLSSPPFDRDKLSLAGLLLLSYGTAQLMLNRALVRLLHPDSPHGIRASIRSAAGAELENAIRFIESLQPAHLQQFWGYASPAQLALIGSVAGLMWATSMDSTEAYHNIEQLERIRWSLQTRAKSAPFLRTALAMFDEEVGDLALLKATTSDPIWL